MRQRQVVDIRPFENRDWLSVWSILEPTFRSGETYAFSPDITESEAHKVWIELPAATLVACRSDGAVLGTYFIKPNHPGLGSHICNCGYVVDAAAQGKGVGSAMCAHSQREAVARGYCAMQFNSVVSTNKAAVTLWQKHGFSIVGVLPEAFRHRQLGVVDAYVMHKKLQTC